MGMKNPFRHSATLLAALFGIAVSLSLGAGLWGVSADTRLLLADEVPPEPVASYKIDVQLKLDDKQRPKHLEGVERLTWLNHSQDTISELQFHLYLNAFKNEKSTFFEESGGQLRGDEFQPGAWASFALVGQWFPKIGVWESAGERRRATPGWNCHQFHATSEFYADFGNYDVTMTVPAAYKSKIGATGVMKSERDNQDGTVTYNFVQDNVHDFAWTVDTNYLIVKRRFKADEHVTDSEINDWSSRLNLPVDRIAITDVDVTALIQPEHRDQIDRHFKAAFNAIKYFGLWYGNYPYNTLTIVDPPYNGGGAGGMEYPP